MKKIIQKTLALFLACSMLLSVTVLASPAYGEKLTGRSIVLHDDVTLQRQIHWSSYYSDLRQEHYVTFTPGSDVYPLAMFGNAVTNKTTATAAAALLEQEDKRVVFGINGDFFDANGTPTGLLISGGKLLSSDAGNYAIGFTDEGDVVIGKPLLSLLASVNQGEGFYLAALNKARSSTAGIFAYTHDFNAAHTTGTSEPGVDVVLSPLPLDEVHIILENEALARKADSLGVSVEELTTRQRSSAIREANLPDELSGPAIGEKVWYKVAAVVENTGTTATPVAEEQLVLSVNAKAGETELARMRAMQVDDIVSIDIAGNGSKWNSVTEAVGGLHLLVENGVAMSGLGTDNAPRTAVGVKKNGDVVLYTVDGRQSGYSIGSSLNTLAQRMAELGCVTAICLDGGGSTTAIASLPDSNTVSVLNSPSDSSQRKVSNLLLLVSEEEPSNHASRVYLDTDTPYVLAGSTATFRAALVDRNHYPMSTTPTLRASAGKISGMTFTAPDQGGTVKITASAQGRSDSMELTVVETPDELRLYRNGIKISSLSIAPGESVDLSASAYYKHLPLTASDEQFTWSVSEELGRVSSSGVFTAALVSGKGTLRVTKGDQTLSIPVTVTTKPLITLEDFETDSLMDAGYNTTVSAVEGGDTVRYGSVSMQLDYTGVDAGGAAAQLSLSQPAGYDRLTLSVYGDGSGNVLSLYDSNGTSTELTVLDFTGWKQLSLPVAPGTRFTALTIQGSVSTGTLYFDQFVASYGNIIDNTAPVITGTLENGILAASVVDESDGNLTTADIALLCDDAAVPAASFTLDDGMLSADLSSLLSDGKSHRITLKAEDASGNRSRMSWDVAASSESAMPFVDCFNPDGTPHWANSNIQYFYDQGLLAGYDVNGQLYARPNNNMTRAEFAVLLFRYLNLDARDYLEADVPYADMNRIDPWAMDAAKAMYVLGIMKGSATDDGKTYFSPTSTITRAQAITMLGRLQEKGYAIAELTEFTDAADVPDWSVQHFKTMVAQNVINGSDGKLSPNAAMTRAQALKVLSLMR